MAEYGVPLVLDEQVPRDRVYVGSPQDMDLAGQAPNVALAVFMHPLTAPNDEAQEKVRAAARRVACIRGLSTKR